MNGKVLLPDLDHCTGCTACAASCPRKAIAMVDRGEGFLYPRIDENSCVGCLQCVRVCPVLNEEQTDRAPVYASVMKRIPLERRAASASGGAFAVLAEAVLASDGVVYGCAFDEDFEGAHHIRVTRIEELSQILGSKYMQSDLRQSFKDVLDDLEAGRKVLFSGLPCQIAGLKRLCGNNENLILVELICNSVASPALWQVVVRFVKRSVGRKIVDIRLRAPDKHRPFLIQVKSGGSAFYRSFSALTKLFSALWFSGAASRRSCKVCPFKYANQADLTIGDAWGVSQMAPEGDDGRGVSEVLVWSDRGRELYERAKVRTLEASINYAEILKGNPFLRRSITAENERLREELFGKILASERNETWKIDRLTALAGLKFWQRVKRRIFG